MKTTSILLALAFLTVDASAIDAVLTNDASVPLTSKNSKYHPEAPRLRIDEKNAAFLHFNIQMALPDGTIASDVKKAVLRVWVNSGKDFSAGFFAVKRITIPWGELVPPFLPNRTLPIANETVTVVKVERKGAYVTFDITSLVQEWVGGADNFGIALVGIGLVGAGDPDLGNNGGLPVGMWIDSKENKATSHEPTLQLVLRGN